MKYRLAAVIAAHLEFLGAPEQSESDPSASRFNLPIDYMDLDITDTEAKLVIHNIHAYTFLTPEKLDQFLRSLQP